MVWPPWICLALGLGAAAPYAVYFAAPADLVTQAGPLAELFSGSFVLWAGLLFGIPGMLTGWLWLSEARERFKALVLASVAGITLGVLGIVGNWLILWYSLAIW
jgi:hypothetical protein